MALPTKKLTLKIEYQGEVRRFRDWPANDAPASVEEMRASVCQLFGLHLTENDALTLKYRDDEGDLCTIAEPSLSDALMFASESGILRLTASLVSEQRRKQTTEALQTGQLTGVPEQEVEDGTAEADSVTSSQNVGSLEEPAPAAEISPLSRVTGFISDRLVEGRRHASHATGLISDRFEERRHHASQQFTEIHRHTSEQIEDNFRRAAMQLTEAQRHASAARRKATDHFENVRPHLCHGVTHFKKQVAEDFNSSCQDMEKAFGAEEQQSGIKGKVRTVAGTATGLLSALRLAPVRATRLAAHSVASFVSSTPPATAETDTQSEQTDTPEDTTGMSEFEYFKHQVAKDFKTVRKDIKMAFDCIISEQEQTNVHCPADTSSNTPSLGSDEQREEEPLRQAPEPSLPVKTAIPEVVSTVAGAGVAVCLVPLRVARLAVATLAQDKTTPVDENSTPPSTSSHELLAEAE